MRFRKWVVRLRRVWRDILFRAIVLLALALMALNFSKDNTNREQKNNSKELTEEYGNVSERNVSFYTLILDVLTGALAVSTFGLWVVTVGGIRNQSRDTRRSLAVSRRAVSAATAAAKAARDQVEQSQSALVTTERSFVVLDPFLHKKEVVDGQDGWSFRCVWRNVGKTPTKYMKTNFNRQWRVLAGTLPFDDAFDDAGPEGDAFLGPQNTSGSLKLHIPEEILVLMKMGQAHAYLWGWTEYNDVFQGTPRHRTEFCAEIIVIGDPSTSECEFGYGR